MGADIRGGRGRKRKADCPLAPPTPSISRPSSVTGLPTPPATCRCGIKAYRRDGRIRYIRAKSNHPANGGIPCAKGSVDIMTENSPASLSKPLTRVGHLRSGGFQEIEWGEAMLTFAAWLGHIRATDLHKFAFVTRRNPKPGWMPGR
jgi:anaerobic selenocysteine-containing dehydrogenase